MNVMKRERGPVLLVDDDKDLLQLIAMRLSAAGYSVTAVESGEAALAALETSQRNYDRAVAFIAAHDSTIQSPDAGDVFRTRLAALDEMAETSRQALSVAPTDPVLNQYYLSTLGAREVTLRQLGSVLPPGTRLSRF